MNGLETILLTSLNRYFDEMSSSSLFSLRKKAWEKFQSIGLPKKKDAAFQYVVLRDLEHLELALSPPPFIDQEDLKKSVLPECCHSHLVFVNGSYVKELSNLTALKEQTVLLSLDEAMKSQRAFLESHFATLLKEEKDPFTLLNLALHGQGAFLYVPPLLSIDVPIQVLFFATSDWPHLVAPRLMIAVGKQAKVEIILTKKSQNPLTTHLLIPSIEISLDEKARLDLLDANTASLASWQFQSLRASLKQEARLKILSLSQETKMSRESYRIQLKKELAEVELQGLSTLVDRQAFHTHVLVEHQAPNTRSKQLFKGVLKALSQSSFTGKIFVSKEAQKTEAYQLNNHLILDENAVANSQPNLEIFADDVKASHGATVAQIDSDQLFYLKTRGIPEEKARHLLTTAFCREIIDQVPYVSLKEALEAQIATFMTREEKWGG